MKLSPPENRAGPRKEGMKEERKGERNVAIKGEKRGRSDDEPWAEKK